MKTRVALATVALALGATSCTVDNQVSVQMHSICAPPDDATSCTFPAECEVQFIGINAMDTALTDRLWLLVQLNNQNANNADPDTFRGNSRDAYVEEVDVEFEAPFPIPSTTERVGPFTVPASGSSVVSVFPVNPISAAAMAPVLGITPVRVVAKTRVKGHYQDQTEFESAQMEIAIDACSGCFDPTPCTSGVLVAVCPNFGQVPASIACQ